MKKKLLVTIFASTLLLGACADEDTESTTEVEPADDVSEVEESEEAEETKEDSDVGTRSNPVSIGDTVTQDYVIYGDDEDYEGNRSITLSNFKRGEEVYDYLIEANEYNDEAPEGMEWAMVDVDYVINELDTEDEPDYVSAEFVIVDSDGSEVSQDEVYPTYADGDEFGYVEVYNGGNASGKYAFYVPEDDDFILKYDDYINDPLFFKLK